MSLPSPDMIRWIALIVVTGLVSVLFVDMVQPFLIALLLAAITAELFEGVQARMLILTRKRKGLAAGLSLVVLCVSVVAPVLGVTYLAAQQAQGFSQAAAGFVAELQALAAQEEIPDWVPFGDLLGANSAEITAKLGELAGAMGGWVAGALGQLATGTAQFFLDLFVYLYALFLFLQMDRPVIAQVLAHSGLAPATQRRLAERMVSISRATLKGTLVIGAAQGALGALGFWATGIEGAAFWGVVMAVLSIIPGLGPLLIIFFGVLWLFAQGDATQALGLAVWGMAVVGTIDNILRPVLVGRDAALSDILILVSTLGGLAAFGAAGLVLGPVLAGLFVTLWETLSRTAAAGGQVVPTSDVPPDVPPDPDPAGPDASDPADRSDAEDTLLDDELAAELARLRRDHARRAAHKKDRKP